MLSTLRGAIWAEEGDAYFRELKGFLGEVPL
jgi:hypothetical protein